MPPITEAETCRTDVLPRLHIAGWEDEQIREQVTFTDGRIVPIGGRAMRKKQQRADYILRYRRDFPIAVVEAKTAYRHPADGLPQAKAYAENLGVKFTYATNGHGIIEFDYLTGATSERTSFPSPGELWRRLNGSDEPDVDDPYSKDFVIFGEARHKIQRTVNISRSSPTLSHRGA
jgi:type I restriction enzyme, R subunit